MTISTRAAEPNDYDAIQQIFVGPKVIWGTLQLPFPSAEIGASEWPKHPRELSDWLRAAGGYSLNPGMATHEDG